MTKHHLPPSKPSSELPTWSTACLDWEERIVEGRSLIPFAPLFPDEAKEALAVFNGLRVVDLPGSPTLGEICRPWATEIVGTIFGAYETVSGIRHINDFHLDIAKKNIKSTLLAGVMTTALIRNWRRSGEFFILAPTKEIADNSFLPMRDMVGADEELKAILHVQPNFRMITHRNTGAFLRWPPLTARRWAARRQSALLSTNSGFSASAPMPSR